MSKRCYNYAQQNCLLPVQDGESIYNYKGSVFLKYKIVWESDEYAWKACDKLEKEVQKLCNDGWKLQGGVTVVAAGRGGYCTACQAMVKEN